MKFDILVIVLALCNVITIPLKVAFKPEFLSSTTSDVFDAIIDFIFVLDIIISFRTTFFDSFGHEVDNPRKIAWNYLQNQFWIDLGATIPFDKIFEAFIDEKSQFYEVLGILKLGRVLRINKFIAFMPCE
jgi:hypothetical protein